MLTKKSSRQRQGGLVIIAFGGFLNGIPAVLDSSFNGWCGSKSALSFPRSSQSTYTNVVFAASAIISATVSVYIWYLCSMEFRPVEIATWSNIYLFFTILLISPLYAYSGLQKEVHSFADLFWYNKDVAYRLVQELICLFVLFFFVFFFFL
jgi:hypothetical protein